MVELEDLAEMKKISGGHEHESCRRDAGAIVGNTSYSSEYNTGINAMKDPVQVVEAEEKSRGQEIWQRERLHMWETWELRCCMGDDWHGSGNESVSSNKLL